LKPSIVVEGGEMRPDRKYRGNIVRCTEKYAGDVLAGAANADCRHVFITHSPSDPEIVDTVRAKVSACGLFDEIHVADAGCVVSCHCGPNTIGILYMEK
jgi:fatty acid-binding protein DegV